MSLHLEAISLYERGNLEEAQSAVERFLQHEALDHVQFGDGLLLLSCIHCAMHSYEEAERMAATCLGYLREHLGPLHRGIATSLLNRGVILLERYYHTNDMYLLVRRRAAQHGIVIGGPSVVHGDDPLHQASSSTHLLQRSRRTSMFDSDDVGATPERRNASCVEWVVSAKEFLEEGAALLQNVFGVERLVLADMHHNLGCCCEILGGYTDAMEHYMRSLKIREKFKDVTGSTDLKLALTFEHVALVYRLTESKLAEAQRLLSVVARTRRKYLGPMHPLYATTLFEQGVCAFEGMHTRQAVTLFHKCCSIRTDTLGWDHPDTQHVRLYLKELGEHPRMPPRSGAAAAPRRDDASGAGMVPHLYDDTNEHHAQAYRRRDEAPVGESWSRYSGPPTPNESVELEVRHVHSSGSSSARQLKATAAPDPPQLPHRRSGEWTAPGRIPPLHPGSSSRSL